MSRRLEEAIEIIKLGYKESGKRLLIEVTEADPNNEKSWLWMTAVVDTDDERRACLDQILRINPNNQAAIRGLAKLDRKQGDYLHQPEVLSNPNISSQLNTSPPNGNNKQDIPQAKKGNMVNSSLQCPNCRAYSNQLPEHKRIRSEIISSQQKWEFKMRAGPLGPRPSPRPVFHIKEKLTCYNCNYSWEQIRKSDWPPGTPQPVINIFSTIQTAFWLILFALLVIGWIRQCTG